MFDIREHGGNFGGTKSKFFKTINVDDDSIDMKMVDKFGDLSHDNSYVLESLSVYSTANYSTKVSTTPLVTGVISGASNTTLIAVGKSCVYGIYYVNSADYGFFSMELTTGTINKLLAINGQPYASIQSSSGYPITINGVPHILIFNSQTKKLNLYTENFNSLVWSISISAGYVDILVSENEVLLLTYTNILYSLNVTTGALALLCDNSADGSFRYKLLKAKDGNYIVCSGDTHNNTVKKLYCIDGATKTVKWSFYAAKKTIFVKSTSTHYVFMQIEFYNGIYYAYYLYFDKTSGVKRGSGNDKNLGFYLVDYTLNKQYARIYTNGNGFSLAKIEG